MIRVLHVIRSLEAGGIGAFIMNMYRKIDRSKIQFDFAVTSDGDGIYGDEIRKLGGNIYFISNQGNKSALDGFKQIKNLYLLCKRNQYHAVHSHYYFANAYFLWIAKINGVHVRVSHCHNTRTKKVSKARLIFESISRKILYSVSTTMIGCSEEAARFLYGKKGVEEGKAIVVYNGIDYSRWNIDKYDKGILKEKYDVNGKKTILFVGRLEEQKNPIFALSIAKEIHKIDCNTVLFMVGDGSFKEAIKKWIDIENAHEYIHLLPQDSNIVELQAISELMIAPSKWEGLPIAFIEAQVMETPVLTSTNVPTEVDMGRCYFLNDFNLNEWTEKGLSIMKVWIAPIIEDKKKAFDVNVTVAKMSQIYEVR